jgi:AcrR family transcriptional regulator
LTSNVNVVYISNRRGDLKKDSRIFEEEQMATRKSVIRKKVEGAYHHGDLKASLKKAALHLVREKGPRGFSLNEASRLAGVTVAAPYRHFEDKDALLAEIACDGLDLMVRELREAAVTVGGIPEQMLEVGMAYLRFSAVHADYFAVIFNAGLDKSKYSDVGRAAEEAYGVILELAQQAEKTPELAAQRAVSAWALVHGFATLSADRALSTAMEERSRFEHLRPLIHQFLNQH